MSMTPSSPLLLRCSSAIPSLRVPGGVRATPAMWPAEPALLRILSNAGMMHSHSRHHPTKKWLDEFFDASLITF